MKILIIDSEDLGTKSSVNLDDVVSIEPYIIEDGDEKEYKLIAWLREPFTDDDSHEFFLINLDGDDLHVSDKTAVELINKMFKLIADFWIDETKTYCYITDATLRGYIPKLRMNPFE